ncbi:hypothetical protein AUC69_01840 [Methyloceanibacter superfactus]|uniref:Autotransporter domain-containing protein n=1 Tax=Methyloceanibacter superfactus TaxID=1774969 RepID=A0A1E3VR48_9HYPH|nr:hypothetical protein [Methyloceanibacter superfactus]ODR95995.1 hypothetical protein AUC69_01840 [Methyloceanibacter superfactus]
MLLCGYGRPAQAQVVPPAAPCNTVSGSTVTCSGNVSAGIAIDQVGAPADTFSTLNVNGVTRDIAPASMIDGIYFGSDGNVTINSDTGPFSITTTGDNADGIEAYSYNGNVKVTHAGDIITRGDYARGIYADGVASTIVDHTGNITTRGYGSEGIYATGYGRVSVKQTGTITTQGVYSDGIYATAFGGPITVNQTGSIVTHGDGAWASTRSVRSPTSPSTRPAISRPMAMALTASAPFRLLETSRSGRPATSPPMAMTPTASPRSPTGAT